MTSLSTSIFGDIFGDIMSTTTKRNPPRGRYACETSINALGIDWDVAVTYNASPGGKGYAPPGDRQIEPDYGPELELITVELTAYDNGDSITKMSRHLAIDYSTLDAEQVCALEDKCMEDYDECHSKRARDEARADMEWDARKDREAGL